MYINNISGVTPFQSKQKLISNCLKTGSAVSASVLFANAIKEVGNPSRIIDEYYENEYMCSPNKLIGYSLSRFSPAEKYEFMHRADEIKLKRGAFRGIVNAKNEDNSPRFNADESLIIFDEVSDNIQKYPEIFKRILDEKDEEGNAKFSAEDCVVLMRDAEFIDNNPAAFNSALKIKNTEAADYKRLMLEIVAQKEKELAEAEAELEAQKESEAKIKEEQNALKLEEKLAVFRKQSEEKALRRAEERRIRLEKIAKAKADWDEKTVWVSPERLFEKVQAAVAARTPLILESGEILPDKIRDKMAENIAKAPKKAVQIVNMRYKNMQPVFDEKDCCEVISDLTSYYHVHAKNNSSLREIDKDGKPFFTAEQCKELLKINTDRCWYIKYHFNSINRDFTSDEIVEMVKNLDFTRRFSFRELLYEKSENGEYKYSVAECIEKCRS